MRPYISLLLLVVSNFTEPLVFKPNYHAVYVASDKSLSDWDYKYKNPREFVQDTTQGGFVEISSGEENQILYAIFRDQEYLIIVALPSEGGRFAQFNYQIKDEKGDLPDFTKTKSMPLVSTDVIGPTNGLITNKKINVGLYAYCTHVSPPASKKLTIYYTGQINKINRSFRKTILW